MEIVPVINGILLIVMVIIEGAKRLVQLGSGHIAGQGCIYLLDDDRDIRAQLGALLRLLGYEVRTFSEPLSFLDAIIPSQPCVAILDMAMPQMSGIEVQKRLAELQDTAAVVLFLSGNSDRQQIVQAMKAGADDFLWKPISRKELEDSVAKAMSRSAEKATRLHRLRDLRNGLNQLSPRERQIFDFMIDGHQNRQIARQLNIRADTVKKHRATICEKFLVSGTPDLIAFARTLGDEANLSASRTEQDTIPSDPNEAGEHK